MNQPLPVKTMYLLTLVMALLMIVIVFVSEDGNPLPCKPVGEVCRQIIVRESLQGFPRIGWIVLLKTSDWMRQCGIETETIKAKISGYVFNYYRAHQYPAYNLLVTYDASEDYSCATELAVAPEVVDWDWY